MRPVDQYEAVLLTEEEGERFAGVESHVTGTTTCRGGGDSHSGQTVSPGVVSVAPD